MKNKMGVKPKPKWKCPRCLKILSCESELTSHLCSHKYNLPFRCPHCQYTSTRADCLSSHIRRTHTKEKMKSFSCRICKENFPSQKILTEHMKNHLKCYFCQQKVQDSAHMQRHLAMHTTEKPFFCTHCQHSTAHNHHLKRHIRSKHPNAKQPFRRRYLLPEGVWRVGETLSAAVEGSADDGGANPGSKDEGTIPQPIETEETKEKFYIKEEDDDNVSTCGLSGSAKKSSSSGFQPPVKKMECSSQIARKKNAWKCPHCPKIYSSNFQLEIHIRIHTGERPFPCLYCPAASKRLEDLRRHIRRLHPEVNQNLIECKACQNKFQTQKNLKTHMEKHLKCYFCSVRVRCFRYMEDHLATHTGEKPFSCPHCLYSTTYEHNLKDHIRIKHPNGKTEVSSVQMKRKMSLKHTNWKCPHCPIILNSKFQLAAHTRVHTGERPFSCPHCSTAMAQLGGLRRHILRVHPKENQNFLPCRICQQKFPSRRILMAHMQTHKKCYFCSHKVKQFSNLRIHLATHTTEKTFKCPHCPHSTTQKQHLKDHILRIHVKQSLVPSHNNKYNAWRSLKTHGQLHCYFCPYRTSSSTALVTHVRNHTGEKPFNCPRCSYAAKQNGLLKTHIDKMH